jgi:uncharacterized membrane protein HdeD (DUF308 family)/3',5'-cyclic AMP phosphodiesterase CpdA
MARFSFSFLQQKYIFTGIGILLGVLALMTPFWEIAEPASYVGGLLVWAGILEIIHGFRRAENISRNSAWFSGAITVLIGALQINAILFLREALVDLIICLFLLDGLRYIFVYFRNRRSKKFNLFVLLSGLGNIVVVILILIFRGKGFEWLIALSGALRIFSTVFNLYTAKLGNAESVSIDIIKGMGLEGNKELEALANKLEVEYDHRAPIDAGWVITFIFILFFIHLGRMGLDRSFLGIMSPVVAVIGDLVIALIISFGVIAPFMSVFKKVTGLVTRKAWSWVQKVPETERKNMSLRGLTEGWLTRQMRLSIGFRKSGYSFLTAIRNGLKIGLPFSALLAAIMPVLGMSWYFDTENWASGIWDGWAGSRTEVWRQAMINVSGEKTGPNAFRLMPGTMNNSEDFSFVVVGDPGEGDASQHVLKDQILSVSNKTDVDFVVISSDIVYPSGAMKDYERKFFLPFKGLTKPVYAIPGNHDWYDALEGFAATFFTPDAARKAMAARIRSDLHITSTNKNDIDRLVNQAAFLKSEYKLPVGFQNAPFFQVSTDFFVLLTIDTGVRRRVDSLQLAWIKAVLEASKGKYVMALLGHPFYAIGEYQGDMNPDFKALHNLLRQYKVQIVMAGDTHDLEYYKELPQNGDGHTMYHFVNGGGGAYLSIGAAMAPHNTRPAADWANYPARAPLVNKIDSLTPGWKYPAWVWTKKYNGYPFSAEWLSAAFDYNQSPYFQSFMEIKVEKSKNRIRLIPYGINGQLRWSDFEYGGKGKPDNALATNLAEWVLPMN